MNPWVIVNADSRVLVVRVWFQSQEAATRALEKMCAAHRWQPAHFLVCELLPSTDFGF